MTQICYVFAWHMVKGVVAVAGCVSTLRLSILTLLFFGRRDTSWDSSVKVAKLPHRFGDGVMIGSPFLRELALLSKLSKIHIMHCWLYPSHSQIESFL